MDYFGEIDPAEVAKGLIPADDDIRLMRWHPGKFMVAFLTDPESRAEGQLRVHIWPDGVDRCDTDIHSHPWDLASKVIMGDYVEYQPTVALCSSSDADWESIGSVHNPNNPDSVRLSVGEPVSVEMGGLSRYRAGEVHHLPAGVYHQTPVSGLPLVTLSLMGHNKHPSFYLRRPGVLEPGIETPRSRVTADELGQAAQIMRQAVNQ
jgi:hypothetical protein